MGLIEELEQLDLTDEVKTKLRQEHEEEIAAEAQKRTILEAQSKKKDVGVEVQALSDMGFEEAPGLLKFARRVFLSDDGEPGIVLLSDADLELSGEEATDAKSREEMSTAEAIRHFISLLPKNETEGKLKVQLSDQALGGEAGSGPDNDTDEEAKQKERKESAEGWSGQEVGGRTRDRYAGARRGRTRSAAGGDS